MVRLVCLLLFVTGFGIKTKSQDLLPDRMTGDWHGYLQIWAAGEKKDSVRVRLSIKSNGKETWQWRMEYFSEKNPAVKDYIIRVKDKAKQVYITDEGGGIELEDYAFGDKMYSLFETNGYWLTSTQELKNGKLVFEVTSGKKSNTLPEGITNYTVSSMQQAVLTKKKE